MTKELKKRALFALLGASVAAFLVVGGVSTCQSNRAASADARAVAVVRDVDASVAKKAAKRASNTTRIEKKEDEKLEKALSRNQDWASQPIPRDVLDSLSVN